jgi:hypothetical protein
MRRTIVVQSAAGTSNAIPVDAYANPVSIEIACVATGTLTYKVQYTVDDIQNSAVTPTWFDHATITGKTATFDGQLNFPVSAVRLNVTAFTSGSVTMTLLQARVS